MECYILSKYQGTDEQKEKALTGVQLAYTIRKIAESPNYMHLIHASLHASLANQPLLDGLKLAVKLMENPALEESLEKFLSSNA